MDVMTEEKWVLRNIDKVDHKALWAQLGRDLNHVPKTWPKSRNAFARWATSVSESYPQRYVVTLSDDSTSGVMAADIAAIVSADRVTQENIYDYSLAEIDDINISYMTLPEFTGRGVASFALQEATRIVTALGDNPILRIASWNKSSIRVAKKCGYEKSHADLVIQETFDFEPTLLEVFRLSDRK